MQILRTILVAVILNCCCNYGFAQIDTMPVKQAESTRTVVRPADLPESTTHPMAAPPKKRVVDTNTVTSLRPVRDTVKRSLRDTTKRDSAAIKAQLVLDSIRFDSLRKAQAARLVIAKDTSTYWKYANVAFLGTAKPPRFMIADFHRHRSKDELFYLAIGLLFCLAVIRAGFSKYFRNLFQLFFQSTLRQKQTRDQLLQDNFASLLINLLFFISAGLYITLLIRYKNWTMIDFWVLALASASALVVIYLGKYLFLRFAGWVFNAREAAGSYIFMVFLVNKVMGVLLIPFVLLLAFGAMPVVNVAVSVSFGLVALLFMYRYLVSFNAIRSRLKVNVLHFFLYLCAVEILPLLLIYKLLINYFGGSI